MDAVQGAGKGVRGESMQSKYKLVAIDIDGTLLDGEGKITPAVRQAVSDAAAAGVTLVLATGRRYRTSRQIALDVGLSTYVLCQHGTHIRRVADDGLVWSAPLEEGTARETVAVMSEAGFEPRVFLDGYEADTDFLIVTDAPEPADMFGYTGTAWRVSMTVDVPRGRQIMEVASYGLKDKLLAPYEEIKRRLGGRVNVHVINPPGAWYWCLEAISPSAGKGSALLALAGLLRIPGDETAAVGDDVNDLDMVSKAGLGIAMGNASEEIRRAADVVVGPNTQDGLAQALRYILACPAKLEPAAPHK